MDVAEPNPSFVLCWIPVFCTSSLQRSAGSQRCSPSERFTHAEQPRAPSADRRAGQRDAHTLHVYLLCRREVQAPICCTGRGVEREMRGGGGRRWRGEGIGVERPGWMGVLGREKETEEGQSEEGKAGSWWWTSINRWTWPASKRLMRQVSQGCMWEGWVLGPWEWLREGKFSHFHVQDFWLPRGRSRDRLNPCK